jgi:hypothetical protein
MEPNRHFHIQYTNAQGVLTDEGPFSMSDVQIRAKLVETEGGRGLTLYVNRGPAAELDDAGDLLE